MVADKPCTWQCHSLYAESVAEGFNHFPQVHRWVFNLIYEQNPHRTRSTASAANFHSANVMRPRGGELDWLGSDEA